MKIQKILTWLATRKGPKKRLQERWIRKFGRDRLFIMDVLRR